MATRLLSWEQLVQEADPDFQRRRLQPWIYDFSTGRKFYAPVPLYPPVGSGLIADGGFLILDGTNGWPTSSQGLQAGQMFSNELFCCAVTGLTPQVGAAPIFFPGITSSLLLLFGAAALPLVEPTPGSTQLWLNGGFVCIA